MKKVKMSFSIPENIAEKLKIRVPGNKRSAFVTEAIYSLLREMEGESLKKTLDTNFSMKNMAAPDMNTEFDAEMELGTFDELDEIA